MVTWIEKKRKKVDHYHDASCPVDQCSKIAQAHSLRNEQIWIRTANQQRIR